MRIKIIKEISVPNGFFCEGCKNIELENCKMSKLFKKYCALFSERRSKMNETIKEIVKEFELSTDTTLTINDGFVEMSLRLKREQVTKFSYSPYKDEVYIDFVTDRDLFVKDRLYKIGDKVENWTIDGFCFLRIT